MPKICDMGQDGFTSISKGSRAEDFFFPPWKILRLRAWFEPANLGTEGQHATSRPPKSH
jgi:hypothetical protein